MKTITNNLLRSLNESVEEDNQFTGTLADYAKAVGELDSDVCDTDIDMCCELYYNPENAPEDNYDRFIKVLCEVTQIEKLGSTIVCKFSDAFKPYNEAWKEIFNMDNSEFDEDEAYYEAVANLDLLISGYGGESLYGEIADVLEGKKGAPINESEDSYMNLLNSYEEKIANCKTLDELKVLCRELFKDGRVDDKDYDEFMDNDILLKFQELGYKFPEGESTYEIITKEVDDFNGPLDECDKSKRSKKKLEETADPLDRSNGVPEIAYEIAEKIADYAKDYNYMLWDDFDNLIYKFYSEITGEPINDALFDKLDDSDFKNDVRSIIGYNGWATNYSNGDLSTLFIDDEGTTENDEVKQMPSVDLKLTEAKKPAKKKEKEIDPYSLEGYHKWLKDNDVDHDDFCDYVDRRCRINPNDFNSEEEYEEAVRKQYLKFPRMAKASTKKKVNESLEGNQEFWNKEVKIGDKLNTDMGIAEVIDFDKDANYILVKLEDASYQPFVAAWAPELDGEKLTWGQGHYYNDLPTAKAYFHTKTSRATNDDYKMLESDETSTTPADVQALIDKAEDLGWDARWEPESNYTNETGGEMELEIWDSSGGDFYVEIFGNNANELTSSLEEYYEGYDPDEEFDIYYEAGRNGLNGVPSPSELINAMKEREGMLKDLLDAFNNTAKDDGDPVGFDKEAELEKLHEAKKSPTTKKLLEAKSKGHKMNMIKYKTDGYVDTSNPDGFSQYKGEDLVNYHEKDFKKGTSVLMPFICDNCGKEYYIKSNIHDFFKQGDFDDPYETPIDDWSCPQCKDHGSQYYNGSPLIKEPGYKPSEEVKSEDIDDLEEPRADGTLYVISVNGEPYDYESPDNYKI